MSYKILLIFFICFPGIINANGQKDSLEDPCVTPNHQNGICVSIYDCSSLLQLLKTQRYNFQVRNLLKTSGCGFNGRIPKVCCKQINTNQIELPVGTKCGVTNITAAKIVNGISAKLDEFPWIVALGYRNFKNPEIPKWLCGGSLITERHVLTAAHCILPTLYVARLGDLDLYSNDDNARSVTIPLTKVKVHEDYNDKRLINDIAILTLKEAVKNPNICPVCLPIVKPFRSMNYVNSYSTVAGWGALYFYGPSSPILQKASIRILRNNVCNRVYGKQKTINEKNLCAGYLQGGIDSCKGDSGGPLMHQIIEGTKYKTYQIGIVSYGSSCGQTGYPGVYTRVTAFIDWIKDNLQ